MLDLLGPVIACSVTPSRSCGSLQPSQEIMGRNAMTEAQHQDAERQDVVHLVKEGELAERWKTSHRTLQRWRKLGYGPRWLKIGAGIRYPLTEILAFEARQTSRGPAE